MRHRRGGGPIRTGIYLMVVGAALTGWAVAESEGTVATRTFVRELDPAYARWVEGPGAWLSFWMGSPEEVRRRTGANAYSRHESLYLVPGPDGEATLHPVHAGPRERVSFTFDVPRPFVEFRVLVSTARSGTAGAGTLFRRDESIAEARQEDASKDPWLIFTTTNPWPAGRYRVEVLAWRGPVDVWPESVDAAASELDDPKGQVSGTGRQLRSMLRYADGTEEERHDSDAEPVHLPLAPPGNCVCGESGDFVFGHGIGEHNNPFFIRYPKWFVDAHPEAFMRDRDGELITVGSPILGSTNPVPAFDDPTLTKLSAQLIGLRARAFRDCRHLRYWVIAGEEAYPDMFGLPPGDFRPEFMRHFEAFLKDRGREVRYPKEALTDPGESAAWAAWYTFREQAVADRAAGYTQAFLAEDPARPVLYPTHGNMFFPAQRRLMGHPPALLAGASDGFETGQITIEDDPESLNLLTLSHLTAFGLPVVTPRLANKTLDPEAMGGGRSFTPEMLRRLTYECLGMGIGHIGYVQWEGDLADGLWHIKDTPAEAEAARVFAEIKGMKPVLAGMTRVQPQVGLYVSDAKWLLERWDGAWTGFFQDALLAGWHLTIVGDALLDESLAERMPLLISINNGRVYDEAVAGMEAYLATGGHVVACGAFFDINAAGKPLDAGAQFQSRHALRVRRVDDAFDSDTRRLVNRASTDRGAHSERSEYAPVRLARIEGAVRDLLPRTVLSPVEVRTSGARVTCFPLTDGRSLAAVLINHEDRPVAAEVSLVESDDSYRVRELISGNEGPDSGALAIELAPRGTAVAWFHRPYTQEEAEAALERAEETRQRWKALDIDTAALEKSLAQARAALDAGLPAKAGAQADAARDALGVHLSCTTKAGALSVRAAVYEADGRPVDGARVAVRVVPGPYEWRVLEADGEGEYGRSAVAVPRQYDLTGGEYEPLSGAARVVCRVTAGGRMGGALANVDLP